MSVLAPLPAPVTSNNPPGKEIGAVTQQTGGVNGWAAFVDEAEYVPELAWPTSIPTYHRMRSDAQVDALHLGTTQPIFEFRWSIDPNKAPASLAEQVATDFGLPIKGHEDEAIGMQPEGFNFDAFLRDALLSPMYGHFYFEIVGNTDGNEWHMVKLSPRHPRTIMEFQTDAVGELQGIRQNISGAAGWNRLPQPLPAGKLVPFVWRPEAGSHVGRSMLRSMYREFLVKDRTIRVAAINIERGAGVPVIEGPQGASDGQLRDLATMARQFKVAEGGGGAIPFGSKLNLVGGSTPDAVALLQYCDEAMARIWALMLAQLGMTTTGNRALGAEFAIYAARAQRSMAKWVAGQVNLFLQSYTAWNLDGATHAPLLSFEQAKPDGLSVAELVALVEAGLLTVDPELESWLRAENALPEAPPPPSDPELGDLSPEEVALVQNSRTPPAIPEQLPKPPSPTDQTTQIQAPTVAATSLLDRPALPLPARELRRQPYPQEIQARVNYAQIDQAHQDVFGSLETVWRQAVIAQQIAALGDQVTLNQAGNPRTTITKAQMAKITAPVAGVDELSAHLTQAAKDGANAALAELSAQGASGLDLPGDEALAARVADQVAAVAGMAANGLSLAAQRKASALAGAGRAPVELRADLVSYLAGLKHTWTIQQLQGAVTMAQNAGRGMVFTQGNQDAMTYYASEILDQATCGPCTDVDGTEYPDLAAAEQDYAAGGYVDCAGGPNCRGTLVATYVEQDPMSTPLALAASGRADE